MDHTIAGLDIRLDNIGSQCGEISQYAVVLGKSTALNGADAFLARTSVESSCRERCGGAAFVTRA